MKFATAVPIGEGGMSEVFKAWDPEEERYVALKFLRWDDPQSIERLMREARAQTLIDHPNVCRIYEYGERDGRPFVAMQYIDGEDLGAAVGSLTTRQIVGVMVVVAEAVHAAHLQGLIHRDLKPSNIMLDRSADGDEPIPYVLDFGLVLDPQAPTLTTSGQTVGTPSFMAPEQFAASSSDVVDRRADVWGLGSTLYSLLLGRPPFLGESAAEVYVRILARDFPDPRQLDPSMPKDLRTILLKCLAHDRRERYPTAVAVAEDLQRWLEGQQIRARPLPLVRRLRRWIGEHPLSGAALGAVLLVGLVFASWSLHQSLQSKLRTALAERLDADVGRIEESMRVAKQMPAHDIGRERAQLMEDVEVLRGTLEETEGSRRAVAHYALGRGLLAIDQIEDAAAHLGEAWHLGYRTPEVAYVRGLGLSERYVLEIHRRRGEDPRALADVEVEPSRSGWVAPIAESLRLAHADKAVSNEWLEALIAFRERRWRDAVSAADRALEQDPWRFEAHRLAGLSYLELGRDRLREGQTEEASRLRELARGRFAAVVEAAPSWFAGYTGLCELWFIDLQSSFDPGGFQRARQGSEEALAACRTAADVDPSRWLAWTEMSTAYGQWGSRLLRAGVVDVELLETAVAHAQNGLDLAPEEHRAWLGLADALHRLGLARATQPATALELQARAVEAYGEAIQRRPRFAEAYSRLGHSQLALAESQRRFGDDPSRALAAARLRFSEAKELAPGWRDFEVSMALAHEARWEWRRSQGEGAEGDLSLALEASRRAAKEGPDNPRRQALLGLVLAGVALHRATVGPASMPESHNGGDSSESWETGFQDAARALRRARRTQRRNQDQGSLDAPLVRWMVRAADRLDSAIRERAGRRTATQESSSPGLPFDAMVAMDQLRTDARAWCHWLDAEPGRQADLVRAACQRMGP